MDGERRTTGDFLVDETALLSGEKGKKGKVASGKITPKDLLLNALSIVAINIVAIVCNLLITPEVHYTQIFGWNFRLMLVVNWIFGIAMTYFSRQSGINTAKLTDKYKDSEQDKQDAFGLVKDIHQAQKRLNELIKQDFEMRVKNLEEAIATLVAPKMPKDESGKAVQWKIGDPLPKKTHRKVKKMKKRLESMTPPEISLVSLVQSEASYDVTSLYDIRPAPEKTGALWFARKSVGKLGWFAVFPVILSIIANGLAVGITIGNVVYTVGIVAVMLFNSAREYAYSYAIVSRYGVDRNKQIVRILETVSEKTIDKAE